MTKVHSRKKRLYGLKTGHKHRFFFSGIEKKNRPKTFRTKEQAEEYAKAKKIAKYEVTSAKRGKRFQLAC
ncbi:MAG: hypothetical protein ABIJ21_08510 [Nanoarchaeota archaeon]